MPIYVYIERVSKTQTLANLEIPNNNEIQIIMKIRQMAEQKNDYYFEYNRSITKIIIYIHKREITPYDMFFDLYMD